MSWFLKWVFRPGVLIVVSLALVLAAGLVMLPERGAGRPQPLPVRPNEQEIAWLYPATNATPWERFATAVQQASRLLEEPCPGVETQQDDPGTLASQSPEVALAWPASPRESQAIDIPRPMRGKRLVFRWYKLTSEWTPEAWIEALLARDPPPLAIIGGNNTYWARELAVQLNRLTTRLPEPSRPLLLLTTATANAVLDPHFKSDDPFRDMSQELDDRGRKGPLDDRTVLLTSIYPGRTFRFCFTNRQMATAVTRFIWSRPELRPDSDPAYLVQWTDDSYSQDLFASYMRVLEYRAAENGLQQWGFVSGYLGLGMPPAGLAGWYTSGFRKDPPFPLDVDSSVGSFATPNAFEAKVVRNMLRLPVVPRRPLLVITGQSQPSRRLLRDLARSAPDVARRFVVAMGDTIPFNTIYRDRLVTWPIQDLPFTLVLFSHRNPIDPDAGFQPISQSTSLTAGSPSGTEDVLLFRDIVEASARAFCRDGRPCRNASELAEGLRAIRQVNGNLGFDPPTARALFGPDGQRAGATGEHIIYLQPRFKGSRVLPEARIEVWARQSDRSWRRIAEPMLVSHDESEVPHVDRPVAP